MSERGTKYQTMISLPFFAFRFRREEGPLDNLSCICGRFLSSPWPLKVCAHGVHWSCPVVTSKRRGKLELSSWNLQIENTAFGPCTLRAPLLAALIASYSYQAIPTELLLPSYSCRAVQRSPIELLVRQAGHSIRRSSPGLAVPRT